MFINMFGSGMFDPLRPYDDLPSLPPATEVESKELLKQCIAARAALAELRMASRLLPNPEVLTRYLLLLEAKDSSEIENIVTTNDALFKAASLDLENVDPATKEAMSYFTAITRGFLSLHERPITTRTAIDLCSIIKNAEIGLRRIPGTTLRNTHTGEVIYTPPEGEHRIRDLLANWETFINTEKNLDPLIRMAIQHYQFEAIHPFLDGNGRTGRVLNILCLVQDGLLDRPTLHLSRHILRTKGEYYRLLNRVTAEQDWQPWISYMLGAVETTARWTNHKIAAIERLMHSTATLILHERPKIYSRELLELIFELPYCRIANLVERDIAKRQTAAEYLAALTEIGVLGSVKIGRDKLFVNRKYSDLLGDGADAPDPGPQRPELKGLVG